ncbi:hypothetical protein J2T13_004603 [Paenibacillus sp. DS2015]
MVCINCSRGDALLLEAVSGSDGYGGAANGRSAG